ncbi:MAG TPA: TPM domain-containing protein [Chitinophagales bacterium]|nr:TPM domain-containing protein [Chitinophagales bacterium]
MLFNRHIFSEGQKKALVKAITEAEDLTSGEIRVHIESKCPVDPVVRATEVFRKLEMDKTAQANGVLIYIAYKDRKFAIIGDKGINTVVPANFWEGTKEVMREHFKRGEFFEGAVFAIRETGEHLKQYFPHTGNQQNQLPNDISEGK